MIQFARVVPGPPMPDSSSSYAVVIGEGQDTAVLFISFDRDFAESFEEGYNLGILVARKDTT